MDDGLGRRLERFLAAAEPGRGGRVIACQAITGGYSRLSSRATVRWRDGTEETFIVRRDPPPGSGVFASDRDAEWELLRALPAAAPPAVSVPAARWYDRSGEYLGAKAIVMDCAAATSLQEEMARAADAGPLADLFADTLAAVHAMPLGRLPLARPAGWRPYLERVLERCDRIAARHPGSAPVLRYVAGWARAHEPPPVPLGLVHGDCQPSNVLVGAGGSPLVIDWEFAHAGDPREDLGYYTQIPLEPNVYWADPERFLRRYREAAGLTPEQVNPEVTDYFLIIGMTVLLEQMLRAADAIGKPARPGILAPYLVNAISHQHDMFLAICDRLS